jgi:hypothetical protein
MEQQPQLNIDLKSTTAVETPSGEKIFQQGFLLRKVSKFIVGGKEDSLLPIPVFYDPKTNKILEATLPVDLREEYKNDLI